MHIAVVVGEPSGDKLGAALIAGLQDQLGDDLQLSGIAGPLMQARGMDSLFAMDELSVMGIGQILRAYPRLKARLNETAEHVLKTRPDVLITIDTPEFSSRLAKIVKSKNPRQRIVHYVAPTVWAWRAGRAAKLAKEIDQLLALFPFEPPYFTKHGLACDFVGHPVVNDPLPQPEEIAKFRSDLGIKGPLILVLPGSRRSEITRHLPIFQKSAEIIATHRPDTCFILSAVAHLSDEIAEQVKTWPVNVHIINGRIDLSNEQKALAFSAADCAIAASGTVALELAAHQTPMVIAYDMPLLSRLLFRYLLKIKQVSLPNIIGNTDLIPEFLGKDANPRVIADAVGYVLQNPDGQKNLLRDVITKLGAGDVPPGARAARAVLDGLGR